VRSHLSDRKEQGDYLEQSSAAVEFSNNAIYLLADSISDQDEDHSLEDENISSNEYRICARCGHLRKPGSRGGNICEHGEESYVKVFRVHLNEKSKALTKCLSCESINRYGVLRMFFSGQEAVTSVIGTALFEEIPDSDAKREIVPRGNDMGFGFNVPAPHIIRQELAKQFIAFSDNRQAAAFYASYLDQTYRSILYKRLVTEALKDNHYSDFRPVGEFVEDLTCQFERNGIAAGNSQSARKEAWKAVLSEMVDNSGATSLYSMGIMGLSVDDVNIMRNDRLDLSKEDVVALCSVFALGMMTDAALSYPAVLTCADKEFFTYNGVESTYTYSDRNPGAYRKSSYRPRG
jgi:hypothetical protein